MNNSIPLVNTLDKFGFCELTELNALIRAYALAGAHNDGKIYAELPESWNDDIEALRDTGADLEDLYRAKCRIAVALIKARLADDPLGQAELDSYSDNELINHCLSDLGREITDDADFYKYVGFIRTTIKAMIVAE